MNKNVATLWHNRIDWMPPSEPLIGREKKIHFKTWRVTFPSVGQPVL